MSGATGAPPATPTPPAPGPAAAAAAGAVAGERHVSEVAGRASPLARNVGVGLIAVAAFFGVGLVLLTSERPNLRTEPRQPELAVRPTVRFEPAPAPPPPAAPPPQAVPVVLADPPPQLPPSGGVFGNLAAAAQPAPARHQSRLLVFNTGNRQGAASGPPQGAAGGGGAGADGAAVVPAASWDAPGGLPGGPAGGGVGGQASGGDGLAARLQATPLAGVTANVLRNRPYLLTTGTVIPCVLQTAMDSTLPGFVTCAVPQDILGPTGIVLLDRGTRVVGQFQGGVRQGVERLFVLWTRAETPEGVVVQLDSPASDPLGRAGLDGEVDRRFWQRFGNALLFTVVQGAIQAGTASVARQGTVNINTGVAANVAGDIVAGSVNLPPRVRKNHGELVSVFVARDLDFSTVYRVRATTAAAAAGGLPPVAGGAAR